MEEIKQLIRKISEINSETTIGPGASEIDVHSVFEKYGLKVPKEILEYYKWANGVDSLSAFTHFIGGYLWVENETKGCEEPFTFKKSIFPFVDINGDVQFCVDLETNELYLVDMEGDTFKKYVKTIINICELL